MASRYKVLSVMFSLDSNVSPFHIMADIEQYYNRDGCVACLKAFCGNVFVCTLCGDAVISRVKREKSLFVNKKKRECKEVDTNVVAVRVDIPYWSLTYEDLNRMMRMYGNIMLSERETKHTYYAIMELKRDLPARLKCRFGFLDLYRNE